MCERTMLQASTDLKCVQIDAGRKKEARGEERRGEELRRHDGATARARRGPTANFWAERGEAPGKYTWRDAGAARAEATGPRAGGARNQENHTPSMQRHPG